MIYTHHIRYDFMSLAETIQEWRIEVEYLGESFTEPITQRTHRFKGYFLGGILPLILIFSVWMSLFYLWYLFILSINTLTTNLLYFDVLIIVLAFLVILSYFWSLMTKSILKALMKGNTIKPVDNTIKSRERGIINAIPSYAQDYCKPIGRWE